MVRGWWCSSSVGSVDGFGPVVACGPWGPVVLVVVGPVGGSGVRGSDEVDSLGCGGVGGVAVALRWAGPSVGGV